MLSKNVICFTGDDIFDVIFYISAILNNLKKQVLIIDCTKEYNILKVLHINNLLDNIFTYRGIDYINLSNNIQNIIANYEIILIVGYNEKFLELYKCIYIVTSIDYISIEKTNQFLENDNIQIDKYILFKDICNKKITSNYFFKSGFIDKNKVKNYYEIIFDNIDYEYKIMFGYEMISNFRQLSKNYKKCLYNIIQDITQISNKEFEKAYNRAKKGEFFSNDNCILE